MSRRVHLAVGQFAFLLGTTTLLTLVLPAASAQLISPISQNRSVSGNASATDDFYYESFEDSDVAPDFGPFDSARSAIAETLGAYGAAGGIQNSTIGGNSIAASGSSFANGEGYDFNGFGIGAGDSMFQVVFDVTADASARLFGSLESYDHGVSGVALTGPSGPVFSLDALGPSEELTFDETYSLPPGQYTLSASSTGSAFGDMFFYDYANSFFDVTLNVCSAGDLDGDGRIGLSDLAALLANYGGPATPEQGDLDGDGLVDLEDLSILLANYGSQCSL